MKDFVYLESIVKKLKMASHSSQYQRNRAETNRMSEDDEHYESCGESNIIEAVNSMSTTNKVVTNANVYD